MAELNKDKTSGSKKLRTKRTTENKSATAMNARTGTRVTAGIIT